MPECPPRFVVLAAQPDRATLVDSLRRGAPQAKLVECERPDDVAPLLRERPADLLIACLPATTVDAYRPLLGLTRTQCPVLAVVERASPARTTALLEAGVFDVLPRSLLDHELLRVAARARAWWPRLSGRSEPASEDPPHVPGHAADPPRDTPSSPHARAVEQLAAGAAHEIKNVFQLALSHLFHARGSLADPRKLREALDGIEAAVRQGDAVLESLVATFRPSTEPQERIAVDLAKLTERTMRLVRTALPTQVHSHVRRLGDGPYWICGSETALRQMILNLVLNAKDAMPDGGDLRVVIRRAGPDELQQFSDARSGWRAGVVLSVTDNGIGMDVRTQARVFEPYFSTKRGVGSGLGLTVLHQAVQEHDGAVDIRSAQAEGTTFTLYFPAIDPPAGDPLGRPTAAAVGARKGAASSPKPAAGRFVQWCQSSGGAQVKPGGRAARRRTSG